MSNTHPTTRRGTVTKRRRASWLAAFFAMVLALAGLTAQTAMAADGPYNIDGVVPDAGTTELADPFGNVKELGPLNSNTTKIGVIHNDALPTLDATNPNGSGRPAPGLARHGARYRHQPRLAVLRLGARRQQRQRLHRLRVHAEPCARPDAPTTRQPMRS